MSEGNPRIDAHVALLHQYLAGVMERGSFSVTTEQGIVVVDQGYIMIEFERLRHMGYDWQGHSLVTQDGTANDAIKEVETIFARNRLGHQPPSA